jgi:hypothetical protein
MGASELQSNRGLRLYIFFTMLTFIMDVVGP